MITIQPMENHILYQREVGWSKGPMATENPELIEQISLDKITKEHVWKAKAGYRFAKVELYSDNIFPVNNFPREIEISSDNPMTDYVEIPLIDFS